jgi:hypothetical protein
VRELVAQDDGVIGITAWPVHKYPEVQHREIASPQAGRVLDTWDGMLPRQACSSTRRGLSAVHGRGATRGIRAQRSDPVPDPRAGGIAGSGCVCRCDSSDNGWEHISVAVSAGWTFHKQVSGSRTSTGNRDSATDQAAEIPRRMVHADRTAGLQEPT